MLKFCSENELSDILFIILRLAFKMEYFENGVLRKGRLPYQKGIFCFTKVRRVCSEKGRFFHHSKEQIL